MSGFSSIRFTREPDRICDGPPTIPVLGTRADAVLFSKATPDVILIRTYVYSTLHISSRDKSPDGPAARCGEASRALSVCCPIGDRVARSGTEVIGMSRRMIFAFPRHP
jgi:hypothetical protein